MSLSTTRELCAFAGAQDVVRGHIELFGMLLYVYGEGVETIIRSVSYVKFRAPRDRAPPYLESRLPTPKAVKPYPRPPTPRCPKPNEILL